MVAFLDFLVLEEQFKMPGYWFFCRKSMNIFREQVNGPSYLRLLYTSQIS